MRDHMRLVVSGVSSMFLRGVIVDFVCVSGSELWRFWETS